MSRHEGCPNCYGAGCDACNGSGLVGGRVGVSVIAGQLVWVGEAEVLGIIPGTLVTEHGETAVNLGRVLEITPTPTGPRAPGE